MANFSDLPTEIQLLIPQNLSKSKRFELKSLNSLFLNLWMDTRWTLIQVEMRNPNIAVRLLRRVVDPFVVTRPKTLTIDLDQNISPSTSELTISKHPKQTFDSAMTILFNSLPLLPNITSLTIQSITLDVASFFQRIPSLSFARKLQSLSLSGVVGTLMSLWECSAHNTPFESLTMLNLYIMDNPITQTKFSLSFEHFLRSLAPTLQSLHILTAIDLSPVFNALAQPLSLSQSRSSVPFPNLLHLNMSLRDPRSLCRFLLTHNNLQHLYLRTTGPDLEDEKFLCTLLTELANHNDQLPSFQTLNIYPSRAGLSALLTLIKRSAPTLSTLAIPIHLTAEEAKKVVDALMEGEVRMTTTTPEKPSKLKNLNMRISYLSVPFLDLLASKLPQLETLSLYVTIMIDPDENSFCDQLSHRRYNPNTTYSQDVLHAWKLQDVSIWGTMGPLKRADRAVMDAVPHM